MSSGSLWSSTPLLFSSHVSKRLGCNVYMKLENLQPAHSFKQRGISNFVKHCKDTHGSAVHCIIASGGNAGLAAADAARRLGLRCSVYIPEGVHQSTLDLLIELGATPIVGGSYYLDALNLAEEAVTLDPNAIMVPAYDNPVLWEGHGSMIKEIAEELEMPPDAIFCSVGGGGLLGGVMLGCASVGWEKVPIVALETHGMNCFYQSISINPGRWNQDKTLSEAVSTHTGEGNVEYVHLHRLNSLASSLGASSPSAGVVKQALDWPGGVKCVSVPDEFSMQAAVLFADEHKMNVELACSTTLVPAYHPEIFHKLVPNAKNVVFIVCGGFKVSVNELARYQTHVIEATGREWAVLCDGMQWKVSL